MEKRPTFGSKHINRFNIENKSFNIENPGFKGVATTPPPPSQNVLHEISEEDEG